MRGGGEVSILPMSYANPIKLSRFERLIQGLPDPVDKSIAADFAAR